MTDLQSLIARLEAATGPDRELRSALGRAFGVKPKLKNVYKRGHYPLKLVRVDEIYPAFDSSIDAALTLAPEGWAWAVGNCGEEGAPWACVTSPLDGDEDGGSKDYSASASTTPIALCIAALRAKAAQKGDGE